MTCPTSWCNWATPQVFRSTQRPRGLSGWLHNGSAITEQTNSTLTLESAQIDDAGFYSCLMADGASVSASTTGSLEVFTFTPDFDIVVMRRSHNYPAEGADHVPGRTRAMSIIFQRTAGVGCPPQTRRYIRPVTAPAPTQRSSMSEDLVTADAPKPPLRFRIQRSARPIGLPSILPTTFQRPIIPSP